MISPLYDMYPKDPVENLRWRIRCRERALVDIDFRETLIDACFSDPLFFMAFAMWSFEPRAKVKLLAFVPWIHQESVFVAIDDAITEAEATEMSVDVLVDKSRAQGGTFGYLWIDLRRWLRDPMFSAGYVTRNESLVDSSTDSDTLFWKLAWGIEKLPFWMVPRGFEMKKHRSLSMHSLLNPESGATLVGYSAGQDVGMGGRKTCFTCLAAGTLVVTDRGPVPIEEVELQDRVWDGTMWISHDGVVYRGERETISAYGIRLTPDHRVFTVEGCRYGIERYARSEVRFPDGYQERWCGLPEPAKLAMPVSVWQEGCCVTEQPTERNYQELRLLEADCHREQVEDSRPIQDEVVSGVAQNGSEMHEPGLFGLRVLWKAWNYCVRSLAEVREFHPRHGREGGRDDAGENRQRSRVFPRELQVGDSPGAGKQHSRESHRRDILGGPDSFRGCESGGNRIFVSEEAAQEGPSRGRTSVPTDTPEAVYDLLNCLPGRAFTVIDDSGRPLLVHNCDEFGSADFISGGKDESVMESLHDVTNNIRLVSARYRDSGVFHEACEDTDSSGIHLILDWKDNPIHGKNSYVVRDGRPEAVKPEDQGAVNDYHAANPDLRRRLERKGFKFEGRVRSPWYNMRCLRPTSTPRLIASQLDRDPAGAVGKVFPTDLLDRMKHESCRDPVWRGTPVFDSETLRLTGLLSRDDGPLKLWFRPGPDDSCPLGPFTVGCDIAIGSDGAYSSNSVASGIDDRAGEQVLEYTIKGMPSIKFARNVVGLCKWLHDAYLGWEDSGMAAPFAKEVMEVWYYGNVYYRETPEIGSRKKTRKAGWWNGKDEHKADLFEKMALGMETGKYVVRSEDLIRECGEYEWDGGKIVHQPTKNKGATEKAHGDRTISSGVAWLMYSEQNEAVSLDTSEETGETPQIGSFLWRERQERTVAKSDSPEFGLRDLVGF